MRNVIHTKLTFPQQLDIDNNVCQSQRITSCPAAKNSHQISKYSHSPWKSQSEWQRTEKMEKLHSCCGQPSRIAKEQNRTEPTHKELSVVLISDSASFSHTMLHTTSGVPVNLSVLATTRLQCLATRLAVRLFSIFLYASAH